MTLFQVDVKALRLYNLRVEQLKSYRGTADELPGDNERLCHARTLANRFLSRMMFFHLENHC